jgi:hypothetical protein
MSDNQHLEYLQQVADNDVKVLLEKETEYGSSWKKRGGVGAFMMLARKWDRIENHLRGDYNILAALYKERDKTDGLLDDISDLRRYLMLVEAEVVSMTTGELFQSENTTQIVIQNDAPDSDQI